MSRLFGVLLASSLPVLLLGLRAWVLAASSRATWGEGRESDLDAVGREIAWRRARVAELGRTGGSGGWTAAAAMRSHRRRLDELVRWRRRLLRTARRAGDDHPAGVRPAGAVRAKGPWPGGGGLR
jgi:hypothetical protein